LKQCFFFFPSSSDVPLLLWSVVYVSEELKALEVSMKKNYEIATSQKREKALTRSQTLEQHQELEHERVRAELDKKIQKEMQDYIVYGSFGAKPPSSSLSNSRSCFNFCFFFSTISVS
jgi:hypothetical protein